MTSSGDSGPGRQAKRRLPVARRQTPGPETLPPQAIGLGRCRRRGRVPCRRPRLRRVRALAEAYRWPGHCLRPRWATDPGPFWFALRFVACPKHRNSDVCEIPATGEHGLDPEMAYGRCPPAGGASSDAAIWIRAPGEGACRGDPLCMTVFVAQPYQASIVLATQRCPDHDW